MYRKLRTNLFATIVVGLAVAVMVPTASAKSSPQDNVTIPEWLARTQYPGSSSEPTVYVVGGVAVPAWLARLQHPGSSSEPTVYVNGPTGGPATPSASIAVSAGSGFDWGAFGIGVAAATGLALVAAGGLLRLRRRHTPKVATAPS